MKKTLIIYDDTIKLYNEVKGHLIYNNPELKLSSANKVLKEILKGYKNGFIKGKGV